LSVSDTGRTLCRVLVVSWAGPQVVYLAMTFGFSLVPRATYEEYANAPLPTTPGPLWLYLIYAMIWLLQLPAPVLILSLLVTATPRVRQLTVPGSARRPAWLVIAAVGLALEATVWSGVAGLADNGLLTAFPSWTALALALGLAAAGAVMLLILRPPRVEGVPEVIGGGGEPGQPDLSAAS
jgi:hypothetical protein